MKVATLFAAVASVSAFAPAPQFGMTRTSLNALNTENTTRNCGTTMPKTMSTHHGTQTPLAPPKTSILSKLSKEIAQMLQVSTLVNHVTRILRDQMLTSPV